MTPGANGGLGAHAPSHVEREQGLALELAIAMVLSARALKKKNRLAQVKQIVLVLNMQPLLCLGGLGNVPFLLQLPISSTENRNGQEI